VAHDFRPIEMSVEPPLKHNMFLCRFVLGPLLLMCGNPRQVALEQATHLQIVTKITSRKQHTHKNQSQTHSLPCHFQNGFIMKHTSVFIST